MYSVVAQVEELDRLVKKHIHGLKALEKEEVYLQVAGAIACLNDLYGVYRDLEKDLGGYIVIVYGKDAEETCRKVLEYHHLNPEDYEWEDIIHVPECSAVVTFRLYLCSSDYSVGIIRIEERQEVYGKYSKTDRIVGENGSFQ